MASGEAWLIFGHSLVASPNVVLISAVRIEIFDVYWNSVAATIIALFSVYLQDGFFE
jgi:hypothetical protein